MSYVLEPTRWYWPSPSDGPQPCRWEGWGPDGWVVITLFGA